LPFLKYFNVDMKTNKIEGYLSAYIDSYLLRNYQKVIGHKLLDENNDRNEFRAPSDSVTT
jgi:hypothetical protein